MDPLRIARLAWRFAPWLLAAVLLLVVWLRDPAAAPSAPGGPAVVAGEEALTRPARKKWKKRPPAECVDTVGQRFKVQTREPSAEELERLAKQYGFVFGGREYSTGLAGMPMPGAGGEAAGEQHGEPQKAVTRIFGEYSAPRLRYGGTFVSALLEDGELETRFDAAPSPRLGFPMVWGGGATYDVTFGGEQGLSAAYAFLEPIQTKQVYWRLEGGANENLGDWSEYLAVRAEFRSEPSDVVERMRERWRGLRRSD